MKEKQSLRSTLKRLVILPLISLSFIGLLVSIFLVYSSITAETEDGLKNLSYALRDICELTGEGDYRLSGGVLMKGDHVIKDNIVDDIWKVSGVDATIFYGDTRYLTTIKNSDGSRAAGTQASNLAAAAVLGQGTDYFSPNVSVNGESYYGYYIPLRNADQSIAGMVFVGKTRQDALRALRHMVFGVALTTLVVACATMTAALLYSKNITCSLDKTKTFLNHVAHGDTECTLDASILDRKDEFGEMGRFAVLLQKSIIDLIGTDPLTGLCNRRCGTTILENALDKYRKNKKSFSLAIGDIDGFKDINDTYGHLIGDEILQKLSYILREHMAKKGFVARWGGEEFLLLYEDVDHPQAFAYLEELMEDIRSLQLPYQEQLISTRMTFGITQCREGDTYETILDRADCRLYQGKNHGKDQIINCDCKCQT